MDDDTKKALVDGQEADTFNKDDNVIIPYTAEKSTESATEVVNSKAYGRVQKQKEAAKQKGERALKGKVVGYKSKVRTLAIKCYQEQMTVDWTTFVQNIKAISPDDYQVIAIVHNKDEVTDGIWELATEKPHLHVIFRCVDKKKSVRVYKILEWLGIEFRKGLDDDLWLNHGVETVGNYSHYAVYLTHETEQAMSDNKHIYSVNELVSNLDEDGVAQVRQGYTRIDKDGTRVTTNDLIALDEKAYKLGLDLGNFSEWYNALPFVLRANAKMKTVRERYYAGVSKSVADKLKIVRTCIFIKGEPNTGKTYASEVAIPYSDILTVRGGGTGKFDNLRPDHGGILIDDDFCPNLLNMTDNYTCYAYKRNSNNSVWAGDYFVVTSNKEFDEWLEDCGFSIYDYSKNGRKLGYSKHYHAMVSRFYVCSVEEHNGINQLKLETPSTRGTADEQRERVSKFVKFRDKFNETIKTYKPKNDTFDYSDIMGFGK